MIGNKCSNLYSLMCFAALLVPAYAHADCSDGVEPGVDWSGCKKTYKMLDDYDFTGATMVKTDLSRTSATLSRFDNANLSRAVGYRASFDGASFRNTNLTKSEFMRASLKQAEIKDVDWSKSELGRADFRGARLSNVNFEFSNISRARFGGAVIDKVNFWGAYTYRTDFRGADLSHAVNLGPIQLRLACGDDTTILPSNLTAPPEWPCAE